MLESVTYDKKNNHTPVQTCGSEDCACTGLAGKVCDLKGGIYLPPLGSIPSLNIQECSDYQGPLYLPLATGRTVHMQPIVQPGQHVTKGQLLAKDDAGHLLYASLAGTIREQTTKTIYGHTQQPAITLHIDPSQADQQKQTPPLADAAAWMATSETNRHELTAKAIEKAAIMIGRHGETLIDLLNQARKHLVGLIVANAVPLEPTINGPLAILHRRSPEVFAGLSIIKTFLNVPNAIVAYSCDFPIDCATAAQWDIKCLAVTEKYPQGLPPVLIKSLRKDRKISFNRKGAAYIFDLQILYAVGRAVLENALQLQRVITVSGDGVLRPGNFQVPIGMPLQSLLDFAGIDPDWHAVIEGASLTGRAVDPAHAVVSSRSHSFMVIKNIKRPRPERCIRCGWCVMDCPAGIDPARLQALAELGQFRSASTINLEACLECGICSYICPSSLPITESIRMMKRRLHGLSAPDGGPLYG